MNNIESQKGEIVMYQPDETIRLEVRVENESVWLTQQQMAELFKATKQNVSLHIRNIFEEGELEEFSTVKEYLTVRKEGKRTVRRRVNLYNLDVSQLPSTRANSPSSNSSTSNVITSSILLSQSTTASAIMIASSLSMMWSISLGPA